jgi:hypothetical protein
METLTGSNLDALQVLRDRFARVTTDVTLSRFDWRALLESGAVATLSIGRYRGVKALTADDLGLDVEEMKEVDKIVQLGHRLLLPQDVLNQFNTVETRARQVLRQYCLSTPAGLFLPAKSNDNCASAMLEFKTKFFDLVELLVQNLPDHKRAIERQYTDLAKQVYNRLRDSGKYDYSLAEWEFVDTFVNRCMAQFPNEQELRRSFRFALRLSFVPVPETNGETPSFANATDDLLRQRKMVIQDTEIARRELIDGFISSIQSEVYTLVNTVLTDVLGSIEKNAQLQSRSVVQLKNLVEKVSALNFWGDKRLEMIQSEIESLLSVGSSKRDLGLNQQVLRELQLQSKVVLGKLERVERGDLEIKAESPKVALSNATDQWRGTIINVSRPALTASEIDAANKAEYERTGKLPQVEMFGATYQIVENKPTFTLGTSSGRKLF